ncbi:MAG: DMT family transporter [Betaproteobacteria bacterium AqS2]|uniref:DMT family transporter n=1 Tax=Candidatus Amphirhobacter heronislandensis TaxID=1732024 RepID=A0A930UC48_9GAMM|nr:DMT family transporter [Betaproteobacteria bacterium AqS2]
MSAAAPADADGTKLAGIGLLLFTLFLFSCQDIAAKLLFPYFPVLFIIWFRFFGNLLLNLVQVGFSEAGILRSLRTPRWRLQLARSFFLAATSYLYYSAIETLPLTTSISVFFIYPMLIAGLAPFVLGERLPPARWIFIGLGMAGVLLVMRPGTEDFSWRFVYVLAAACTFSCYTMLTRLLAKADPVATTTLYTSFGGVLMLLPPLLLISGTWEGPDSLWLWAAAMSLGVVFGGFGHYLLIYASRLVPAPEMASWFYTQIVWMVIADVFFFDTVPDAFALLGCAVVIVANVFIVRMELRAARQLAAAQAASSLD